MGEKKGKRGKQGQKVGRGKKPSPSRGSSLDLLVSFFFKKIDALLSLSLLGESQHLAAAAAGVAAVCFLVFWFRCGKKREEKRSAVGKLFRFSFLLSFSLPKEKP